MNDTHFKKASRNHYNHQRYDENLHRSVSNSYKPYHQSIYELALSKEFLNDNMGSILMNQAMAHPGQRTFDLVLNHSELGTLITPKTQNQPSPVPMRRGIENNYSIRQEMNQIGYYPYKRNLIESCDKSPVRSQIPRVYDYSNVSPIRSNQGYLGLESKYTPTKYSDHYMQTSHSKPDHGRLTVNENIGSHHGERSSVSSTFISPNKPYIANNYRYPQERATYSYAKEKNQIRHMESSSDLIDESTKPASSLNDIESRIRSSIRGSYNEEYSIPSGIPSRMSMSSNINLENRPSSTSLISNAPKENDSSYQSKSKIAKENMTPDRYPRTKQVPKFLNMIEIGEVAAKSRNSENRDSIVNGRTSISSNSQFDILNPPRYERHPPGISEVNYIPIHKQADPRPATFVAKIDPENLTITTIKTNRGELSPRDMNQMKNSIKPPSHLQGKPQQNSLGTSMKNSENTMTRINFNKNPALKAKKQLAKVDSKITPNQAKDIYNKITNKSPGSIPSTLRERVTSPNDSFHIEGLVESNKINQLNTNLSRQKYNFAEEGDQNHMANLDKETQLKHSKSAPRITDKKIFDFSKANVNNNREKNSASESRRLSYFERDRTPVRASVSSGMTRSTSEEKYSEKKPILQSIQEISQSVFQSTKNLMNRLISSKPRIKCACSQNTRTDQETCPRAQRWLGSKYQADEIDYLKKTYENILASQEIDPKSKKQIKLDILRTYPDCKLFSQSSEGVMSLERVLECYAKYDPQIGYVQGMNFIVAAILYHAEEYIAFWILVLMFEKCEMRDIYMHNLPGLAKHSQIIDFLILNNLPELYSHFCKNNIVVEMFCTEWVCGLFGSVIPIEKMGIFLDAFIENGWPFFYKFILTLLRSCERELRQAVDMSEIMLIFKNGINKSNNGSSENNIKINWESIIKAAMKVEIDNSFIFNLHTNFDQTSKRFIFVPQN